MVHLANASLNCISNNWDHLTVFYMDGFPRVTTIFDTDFWHLPRLETVSVERCSINSKNLHFDEFTGYSSSLKRVSLNGNGEICSGFVVIDNVTYQGFAYGYTNFKQIKNKDLYRGCHFYFFKFCISGTTFLKLS